MEGILSQWMNIILRWKQRYFVLHEDILIYCDKKGGEKKGTIHLKIAAITLVPDDKLRIIINTGTSELILRASSIEEKILWVNALRKAQEECYKEEADLQTLENLTKQNKYITPEVKNALLNTNMKAIGQILLEIWTLQAKFDEQLSITTDKINNIQGLEKDAFNLEKFGQSLKGQITACTIMLEEENKRIYRTVQFLTEQKVITNQPSYEQGFDQVEQMDQNDDESETVFQSFIGEQQQYHESSNLIVELEQSQKNQKDSGDQQKLIQFLKQNCPIKHRLLSSNPIYLITNIPIDKRRNRMPAMKDPNEKINFWSVLKECIGKDLTRITLPVYFNEPVSMLQRFAETLEYSEMLDIANNCEDQGLKLAYIIAFSITPHNQSINRIKKPFNPLLGETFEFIHEDKGFRYFAEQVCHHPPITACFAESNNFEYVGHSQIKTTFWGKHVEVTPQGQIHVVLKKKNDFFTYTKSKAAVNNLFFGQMNIDYYGTITCKNHKTGETGELVLTERGWTGKGAYEVNGWVKDKKGQILYRVIGKWDSELRAVNEQTKQETLLWRVNKPIVDHDQQYYFSDFTLQLNYLNQDLLKKIAGTDCRLRPDLRAYEYGKVDIAATEKFRLEEKQRAARKLNEKENREHKIRWFEEKIDPINQDREYVYKGGYWEAREQGHFDNIYDIY